MRPSAVSSTAPSIQIVSSTILRDPGESGMKTAFEDERHERGRWRHDGVTETVSERKAGAVAAALGKGLSPGREHDCPRKKAAAAGLHLKAIAGRR